MKAEKNRRQTGRRPGKKTLPHLAVFALGLIVIAAVGPQASATADEVVKSVFGENAQTLDIVVLLTGLALIPTLVICLTGFTRIVIVLGFVKNAIGTQNVPPAQVIIGLALLLDFFVMSPVIGEVKERAYIPYTEGEITIEEFSTEAMVPIREFMLEQTYKSDLNFFCSLRGIEEVEDLQEVPTHVIIPSFLTSELKRAFQIGFLIYIPFIVIDMVVASTLMAMGMMMLPPAMISLPFKILLFVLVDGWQLVFGTLVKSFS
ncbi:MAG: flagellar type III secretion system pore protein FliP [Oscillospiraceae bacterium]|jgi:flagellar biosynthetic protein FliP